MLCCTPELFGAIHWKSTTLHCLTIVAWLCIICRVSLPLCWEYHPVDRSSRGSILFATIWYYLLIFIEFCLLLPNARGTVMHIKNHFTSEKRYTLYIALCNVLNTELYTVKYSAQWKQILDWIMDEGQSNSSTLLYYISLLSGIWNIAQGGNPL